MRINVYGEELTYETELVTKTATDDKFGERTFYGLRFYLKSPDDLHHDPVDDDRSAITLWVPWTRRDGHDFGLMHRLLVGVLEDLDTAENREGYKPGDDPEPAEHTHRPKPYKASV